jgi:hypothetical protein
MFTATQTTVIAFVYCQHTTWNPNKISDITTNVLATPELSPILLNAISITAPLTVDCGPVSYRLDQTLSFVSVDSSSKTITVQPKSSSDVGEY